MRDRTCIYCGEPATGLDHIPPKYWRPILLSHGLAQPNTFRTVPACGECNSILGKRPFFTLAERKTYVRGRLWEKYERFCLSPSWSRSELDAMGPGMRRYIRAVAFRKDRALRRTGLIR